MRVPESGGSAALDEALDEPGGGVATAVSTIEAAAVAHVGLCGLCGGARYVVGPSSRDANPQICPACGGDGLASRQLGAMADAARLSVDWLT